MGATAWGLWGWRRREEDSSTPGVERLIHHVLLRDHMDVAEAPLEWAADEDRRSARQLPYRVHGLRRHRGRVTARPAEEAHLVVRDAARLPDLRPQVANRLVEQRPRAAQLGL